MALCSTTRKVRTAEQAVSTEPQRRSGWRRLKRSSDWVLSTLVEGGNPHWLRLAIFTLMDLFPIMVIMSQA